MKTLLIIIFIIISSVAFSQTASSVITKDSINLSFLSKLIFDKINNERAKLNIRALKLDIDAQNFAKTHSQWMVNTGIFEHSKTSKYNECCAKLDDGIFCGYTTYDQFASKVVNGWMNSSRHRAILLDNYTTLAGVYFVPDLIRVEVNKFSKTTIYSGYATFNSH